MRTLTMPAEMSWRFVWRLSVLGILGAVFFLVEPPEKTLGWNALFDVGHSVLFGVAAWLVLDVIALHRRKWSPREQQLLAFVIVAALAIGSEAAQALLPTRVASVADVLRDLAGALCAFLVRHLTQPARRSMPTRAGLHLLLASLAVAALTPGALVAAVYWKRQQTFPQLARLDGSWEEAWLVSTRGATLTTPAEGHDKRWIALRFEEGTYPGVLLEEPYPDWTGFSRLTFAVDSKASQPMLLGVDLYDKSYDGRDDTRFNQNFVVRPGRQTISVALENARNARLRRPLDLTAMRGLRIYAVGLDTPTVVLLSSIHVE